MNILHLRSSGGFFGAEGVILNLAKQLTFQGFPNYILNIKNSRNPHEELVSEAHKFGIPAYSVVCNGRFDLKTFKEIRKFIIDHKINVLHCHDYKANFYGFLSSLFLGVKLVATNHLWTKETLILRCYEFLDALLLNFFDRVVAVSDQVCKDIKKTVFRKDAIATIYNGIDLNTYVSNANSSVNLIKDEFGIKRQDKVVGAVGRLTNQKGFVYFLEAAKKVLDFMPSVTFLIIGEGPLKNSLEEKAINLGIRDKVIIAGARSDMVSIYNSLDLFVLSSLREGLPLVLLEALAMKKPVVATNVGGVSKIIQNEETGILVESSDSSALAYSITKLLQDKKMSNRLALTGRRFVEENFSESAMAAKYKRLYEELVS